ncbi:MAG: lipid-A-disaccharide synthase [Planctomycetes bacterium]|nr:lipid-A-disaccharide synthase [Planctomycetota bacterium]
MAEVASPTLLIVAGEASGDLHGANLARALKELEPRTVLLGAGGQRMREAGVELVAETTAHAAVGIVEAFHQFHHYARLYRSLQSTLRRRRPDAVVLIDFPDFNLRFAGRARDHGIPVVYYVSPQIWAWRPGRIRTIRRVVTKMIVILDFEERLYREAGVDATFVGHPLMDALKHVDRDSLRKEFRAGDGTLIGLLPGSRTKQFASLFPTLLKSAELISREIPGTRYVVACARGIDPQRARARREGSPVPFDVVWDRAADVMAASDLLITASGTATLEAALYGTPMIVTYKLNPVTALTLGPLVRLKDYALVNIVAGRRIMPEYYQFQAKPQRIAREAVSILTQGRLGAMRKDLAEVRRKLGPPGASRRAAEVVLQTILKTYRNR